MNRSILQPEVQAYLLDHIGADPHVIALGKSPFPDVSPAELAAQIDARQRSRQKLPLWYSTEMIYYPAKLSIEQCSSEKTARYKAALLPDKSRILDLTGGMGVDSTFFARAGHHVTHCERDTLLSAIAQHNAGLLGGVNMEFRAGDGVRFLEKAEAGQFDIIYLDPARRLGSQKTFRLSECEPNILELHHLLLEKCSTILLKLSPMLDIKAAIEQIPCLQEIHIVSVDGECKELICRIGQDSQGDKSPGIVVAVLSGSSATRSEEVEKQLSFTLSEEKNATSQYALPMHYLYEPDASLLKSGAFKWTGQHFGLAKLHQHTHLYTNEEAIAGFIGKTTQILEVLPYAALKKSKSPLSGNVIARNFPLKAEDLRRRHRIKENPRQNLYFCTDKDDRLIVIRTVPLSGIQTAHTP